MQEPVTNNNPAADGVSTSMSCCWFFFPSSVDSVHHCAKNVSVLITTTRKFNHKNWNKLNVFPLEETRKCTSNWLGGRPSTGPWQNDCSSWWSSTHTAGNGAVFFSVCVEEVELGRVGVKEKPWMDMFCQVKTRSKFPTNNIGSYDLLHTTRHPPICSPSRPLLSTSSSFFAMVAIDAR